MLTVTHYYREPRNTGVSIEGIFRTVKKDLEGKAIINDFYCDASASRLQNTLRAGKFASQVNHITGDVNFLAMGLRGKKTILTIHDLGYYENPIHAALKKAIYKLFWFQLPLMSVDLVTVVSEFTKEKLIRHFNFPPSRIRVIPNPVKPVFRYVKKERINDLPVVLMLGTGKHKNLDNLIEAARGGGFHLDIVGWPAPDELAKLKEYNIPHTLYHHLSEEQVFERYVACDVLFIASLYEGFGMPIIEAQAVGRPVVTSKIGAMLEVGKGSALLADPLQPAEIRAAITSLLSDRKHYDEVVARGLQNAAKYDHNTIAEQYLRVYQELAKMD
jgi:glycosyltransferase involved in cell wall biosynthesis